MKKLIQKQKLRKLRLQLKKSKEARKKANQSRHLKFLKKRLRLTILANEVVIKAPQEFGLIKQGTRNILLSFLNSIKSYLEQGSRVIISLDDTETLIPCGTLWATAKIECLNNQYLRRHQTFQPRITATGTGATGFRFE